VALGEVGKRRRSVLASRDVVFPRSFGTEGVQTVGGVDVKLVPSTCKSPRDVEPNGIAVPFVPCLNKVCGRLEIYSLRAALAGKHANKFGSNTVWDWKRMAAANNVLTKE
jgi:hypothetical protein